MTAEDLAPDAYAAYATYVEWHQAQGMAHARLPGVAVRNRGARTTMPRAGTWDGLPP